MTAQAEDVAFEQGKLMAAATFSDIFPGFADRLCEHVRQAFLEGYAHGFAGTCAPAVLAATHTRRARLALEPTLTTLRETAQEIDLRIRSLTREETNR